MVTQAAPHPPNEVPQDFGVGKLLKETRSICPGCLEKIPARVFERDRQVWMDKTCPQHGHYSALLAANARHYYKFDEALGSSGSCCGPGQHCGDQTANHSCNMLLEITQRCNLTCPTCYADSSPHKDESLTMDQFRALVAGLLAKGKGTADLIQLSGGEPTIHPDFFEMVEHALAAGIKQVYVNTNGIKLAGKAFAQRLAAFPKDKVHVYLQFDGFQRRTLQLIRGDGDLLEKKLAALTNCEELGINTVLVMVMTPGINDGEVGAFLERAQKSPVVRKVMIQPAMYSGRYDNPRRVDRTTVADVVARICEQSGGTFHPRDFGPIPCSDPNCFSMAAALRTQTGLIPVSRYFARYGTWSKPGTREIIDDVSQQFDDPGVLQTVIVRAMKNRALAKLDDATVDALLEQVALLQSASAGRTEGWGGLFVIGIKPFMDAYTYDQDRIDRCCVHIISRDGTPVSFCEYNAINRPTGRL